MDKSREDIIAIIEGAGSDPGAIADALKDEGCISFAGSDAGGEDAGMGSLFGGEPEKTDEKPDPFAIGEKDDAKTSRGKAAGKAMAFLKGDKKDEEEPAKGGFPFGKK